MSFAAFQREAYEYTNFDFSYLLIVQDFIQKKQTCLITSTNANQPIRLHSFRIELMPVFPVTNKYIYHAKYGN